MAPRTLSLQGLHPQYRQWLRLHDQRRDQQWRVRRRQRSNEESVSSCFRRWSCLSSLIEKSLGNGGGGSACSNAWIPALSITPDHSTEGTRVAMRWLLHIGKPRWRTSGWAWTGSTPDWARPRCRTGSLWRSSCCPYGMKGHKPFQGGHEYAVRGQLERDGHHPLGAAPRGTYLCYWGPIPAVRAWRRCGPRHVRWASVGLQGDIGGNGSGCGAGRSGGVGRPRCEKDSDPAVLNDVAGCRLPKVHTHRTLRE
ncbi:hypothetical protein BJY52DRAFT_518027 [Lactarius psammicola]|nr:hypothetical protein BJY52DRAFT_518027 [Lactarius psammicola]